MTIEELEKGKELLDKIRSLEAQIERIQEANVVEFRKHNVANSQIHYLFDKFDAEVLCKCKQIYIDVLTADLVDLKNQFAIL